MNVIMGYYVKMDYLNKWVSTKLRNLLSNLLDLKNNIPRQSLNYKTPSEEFLSCVDNDILFSLM